MQAPWFFDRLGIAPTSDVKAIKRAYARALKRVDQQTERETFEWLRAAYEQALAWATERDAVAHPVVAQGGDADAGAFDAHSFAGLDHGDAPQLDGAVDEASTEADDLDTDEDDDEDDDPNPTWAAIHEWISRLMHPEGASVDQLLELALDDPRLWHLDGRKQFETQLTAAIFRKPLGQAALFEAASARFDWPARRASMDRSHPQDLWVSRVIDQALMWESLPHPASRTLAAALKAATTTDAPLGRHAFRHGPALRQLHGDFHEWSRLFLSAERFDAWQHAVDDLPANELRRLRTERGAVAILAWGWRVFMAIFRFMRDGIFDTWPYRLAGGFLLVCFIATWLAGGFDGDSRTPAQQATDHAMQIARANAARAAPYAPRDADRPVPVPLQRLPRRLDADACRATHAVLHRRDPAVFDDAELIASLGTHAILCNVNYHWPALSDPIVRCLQEESWAANNQQRPQNNAHCVQATARP